MKRGRKKSAHSGYIMNKHKNGNYFYAYTLRPFTEGEKVIYRRCQWGRLDENLKFYPGLSFVLLAQQEKDKFIFPKEWDISEIERIADVTSKSKVDNFEDSLFSQDHPEALPKDTIEDDIDIVSATIENNPNVIDSDILSKYYASTQANSLQYNGQKLCGATWLIEIWAKKIGLFDDLFEAFYGNRYNLDVFMSLVIYAMTHNYTLDNFYTTQSYIEYPSLDILGEEELGKVNINTGDREIEKFFGLWMKRSFEGEVCAFDSTLTGDIHKDSNPLGIRGNVFRYGYDIEDALKSEFIILYSMSTGYPLCYINYGEDNDVFQNFYDALYRLRRLGAGDFPLFTNRSYDGVHLQVGLLASEGQKLLLPCDTSSIEILKIIDGIHIEDHLPTNMQWNEKGDVYYIQVRPNFESGKTIGPDSRIYLFYSPEKDIRDRMKIQHRIGHMNSNVESLAGQPNMVLKEDFSKANDLIDIEFSAATSNRKFSVVKSGSINKDKVNELTKLCGFYAARSFNVNFSPKEVLNVFRFGSEHKKDLGILKDMLNLQRPYDDERLPELQKIIQGKRFVLFLALIISASLKRILSSKPMLSKVFRDETQMIMEMLSLKGEFKDGKLVGCSPLTPRQSLIVRELRLDQCPGKEFAHIRDLFYNMLQQAHTKVS